jgi:hypothetical protein
MTYITWSQVLCNIAQIAACLCGVHNILNYSKKVKERSVLQAQFLLSKHRGVLPWCTQILAIISFQWTMSTVKASIFQLQCIVLSKAWCGKNAVAVENGQSLLCFVV